MTACDNLASRADRCVASADQQLALRQLRHHSKNALQRLLSQVWGFAGQAHDRAGRALAADLERRIQLSATLSDALFGLTRVPEPLGPRLGAMARAVVGLLSDGDQVLDVSASVRGNVPAAADEVLVRIAHELVGNAVKHGMMLRMVGRIETAVEATLGLLVMTVRDDGWGFCQAAGQAGRGEGLSIAHELAEQHGGSLHLQRRRGFTEATLTAPVSAFERRQ